MKTHTYYNNLIAARLLVLLVAVLTFAPAVAQDSRQYAIFNYRNDGSFNAFLNEEIDSMSYSCIDSLGIEHDEVVVQEVWTPDSLYRIPIDAIDSLAFRAPAPKMRDNLFYIRDYHISHTLSLEDLTIYFNGTINNDSLPSVGQMVLCLLDEQPFDEGFAGRVMEVNRLGDRIEVVCAQASPCDVFERLVLVGMAVSDLNEYESKMKVRRKGDSSMGIEEIELPEKWKDELKVEFLDLLSITSKKPTVRYKYYLDISAFNFYIGGDIWIDHPDLTYKVTFDWDKISKLGKEYDEVKEVWNLFKEGNYDAIRLGEKEKNLEEKQWEKKIPIPFQAGPFDCVFEIGAMIKPEAVNLKANWEMKTSAFHHMGFFVQGHNPLAPSAIGIDEDWKKEGANKWYQKPCTSFKAEVDIEGSLAFGVFARLKASLLTKHLLRASVGAEAGLKLSYTGAFTLTDSDCDVPNVYGLLKDTNVGAKLYGKVKAEAGALPFNLINLQGELEYPFWEGKFYLFPHFTEPSLTNTLYGYSRKDNEMFTTSVSEDLIPFLSCYPGLAFYSDNGNSRWDNREALYLDDISYKFESDVSLLNEIEYSAYEAGLAPGETYRCYPVFKMFGHVWKAGPFTEFTYPKPLSMENPSLILQKNAQQMVRISGGWGDYNISCEPKDVVKAEIEKSGNFSQVRITALKDGTATVKVFDKRSLESATVEIKVFGNPDEGAAITVSEEDIDFGSVAYGEVASGSFKVTNHGSVELAFNVNNSETNINNGFIVNGANTLQYLQPGKSMTFKVTAKGTGPSHYRMGVLYIYSNATKDPVSIGLKVKGKATSAKYVDLGLSVKWAECNLGAMDTASGCGDYFAWGETDSKSSYGWNSYTHCDGTAATSHDLGDIEGTDYDAAHYQWGGKWRMPTADELKELKEKCTWTWDASLQLVGGLPGYRVTGPNGKSIFLEAAGYVDGVDTKYLNKGGVYMSGKQGDESAAAYMLAFEEGNYEIGEADRYKGVSIRPVYDEKVNQVTIKIEPQKIEFGEVVVGGSERRYLTIVNNGSEQENVNLEVGDPYKLSAFIGENGQGRWYSNHDFSIAPNDQRMIVVHFNPTAANSYNSEIKVTSKGVSSGKMIVPVYGKGIVVQEDPSFHLSTNSIDVYVNDDEIVEIHNGSGDYDIINDYPDIVESDINVPHVAHVAKKREPTESGRPIEYDLWNITGKKVGKAVLKVKDKKTNEVLSLNVEVKRAPSLLLSAKTVEVPMGEYNSSIEIQSGSGWYNISSDNPEIATASKYYKSVSWVDENGVAHGGTFVEIQGLKVGSTIVRVKDMSSGETATINVTVTGDDAPVQTETITIPGTNVSFKMIGVEGGTFWMGASDDDPDASEAEKPRHQVTLNSFAIGETEVTQALWEAVMGYNPSLYEGPNRPVTNVTWERCQDFIAKLNELTGRQFRLPTEAEWEYAARGGKSSHGYKYAGSDDIASVAWYYGNVNLVINDGARPVAQKMPNELGLYDMSGNAQEWCLDKYNSDYYDYSPSVNPCNTRESAYYHVLRGGMVDDGAKYCRLTYRFSWGANYLNYITLRLALSDGGNTPHTYLTCSDGHHPHQIDLGLPSGTKWACCNVDDEHSKQSPTNYGSYYAWGEVKEKDLYDFKTYIHCDGSIFNCHDIGNDIGGTQHDVAHVKWGGSWVMPSRDQLNELEYNCTREWTTINGVFGCLYIGPNGNTIFLPAAGWMRGYKLIRAGEFGYYWSRTPSKIESYYAWGLLFDSSRFAMSNYYTREYGLSVRPVINPNGKPDNDVGGSPGNGDGTSGGSDPTHDEYDDF